MNSKKKYILFCRSSVIAPDNRVNLYLGREKLDYCTEYVYLGIRLDNHLSFVSHIEGLIRNCNTHLCTLSKIRKYIDVRTAILIYKAIVMAKLQYGLVFSINALQRYRQKLQVVQNHALRICSLAGR